MRTPSVPAKRNGWGRAHAPGPRPDCLANRPAVNYGVTPHVLARGAVRSGPSVDYLVFPRRVGTFDSEGWSYVRTFGVLKLFSTVVLAAASVSAAAAQTLPPSPPGTVEGVTQAETREAETTAGAEGNDQSNQAKPQPPSSGRDGPGTDPSGLDATGGDRTGAGGGSAPAEVFRAKQGRGVLRSIRHLLQAGSLKWHRFLRAPTRAAGSRWGVGQTNYVSCLQFHRRARPSHSIAGDKRAEAEFVAPRMFNRRGQLSVIGGWREATQVGFGSRPRTASNVETH